MKNPSEEFLKSFDISNDMSNIYGLGSGLSKKSFFNYRLFIMALLGELEQVMAFNRMYESWNNIGELCCLLAIETFAINVAVRYICELLTKGANVFNDIREFIEESYKRDEQNHKYRLIMEKNLNFINITFKLFSLFLLIMCFSANFTSWFITWYTGEFILVAPIYMPWVDPNTLFGYIISSAILAFFTCWLFLVFLPAEASFIVPTLQTIPLINVYCMKLEDFGEELIKSKIKKLKHHESFELKLEDDIELELVNLIKDFNEYEEYLNILYEYVKIPTFIVLSINSMAIGLAVLTTIYYSKVVGGCLALFYCLQVFIPCLLGTIVANQKEKMLVALWDLPWYELSLKKQKIYLQFLHLCQNSKEFEISVIGALNMKTFTSIMNAAYSIVLFLLNVLK